MLNDDFPLHCRSELQVAVDPARLFAHLDDHRRLAAHMEKPSLMTAGGSMRIEFDDGQGRAVGSVMRMRGNVLGLRLSADEAVTVREPPSRKAWETLAEPCLLVIGRYRMGFTIDGVAGGSRLVVFIDYALPSTGAARWLGLLLGRAYAAWCTRRMADDAMFAFGRLTTRSKTS